MKKFLDFDGLKHFYGKYITRKLDKTGDASETTNNFTAAASRSNLASGENSRSAWGKSRSGLLI